MADDRDERDRDRTRDRNERDRDRDRDRSERDRDLAENLTAKWWNKVLGVCLGIVAVSLVTVAGVAWKGIGSENDGRHLRAENRITDLERELRLQRERQQLDAEKYREINQRLEASVNQALRDVDQTNKNLERWLSRR